MDTKKVASILAGLIIGYLAMLGFSMVAQEIALVVALEERRRVRQYVAEMLLEWREAKGYYSEKDN